MSNHNKQKQLFIDGLFSEYVASVESSGEQNTCDWDYLEALFFLGSKERITQLLELWQSSIENAQEQVLWLIYHARLLYLDRNYTGALESLVQVEQFSPSGELHPQAFALYHLWMANVLYRSGRAREALETIKEVTNNWRETFLSHLHPLTEALVYNVQGNILWEVGCLEEALVWHRRSLDIREQYNDPKAQAASLNNMAVIMRDQGKLKDSLRYHEQALELWRRTGWQLAIAGSLNNQAVIYFTLGSFHRATELYHEASAIYEDLNDPYNLSNTLNNLGALYQDQGKLEKAISYYKRALNVYEGLGDSEDIAMVCNNLGVVYKAQGLYSEAQAHLTRALELRTKVGNATKVGNTKHNLVSLYYDLGDYDKAWVLEYDALTLYKESNNPLLISRAALGLIKLLWKQGKLTSDHPILEQFPKPSTDNPVVGAYLVMKEGMVSLVTNDCESAEKSFERVLECEGYPFVEQVFVHELLITSAIQQVMEEVDRGKNDILRNSVGLLLPSRVASLERLASEKHLTPTLCTCYLLESKLALVVGDLRTAHEAIGQAQQLAQEAGLPIHYKLLLQEQEKILDFSKVTTELEVSDRHVKNEELQLEEILSYVQGIGTILADLSATAGEINGD